MRDLFVAGLLLALVAGYGGQAKGDEENSPSGSAPIESPSSDSQSPESQWFGLGEWFDGNEPTSDSAPPECEPGWFPLWPFPNECGPEPEPEPECQPGWFPLWPLPNECGPEPEPECECECECDEQKPAKFEFRWSEGDWFKFRWPDPERLLSWFGFLKDSLWDILWFVAILMFAYYLAKSIIQHIAELTAKIILGLPRLIFGLAHKLTANLVGKRDSRDRADHQ